MFPSFATQPFTVVEPTMVDDRGTTYPDYDDPESETDYQGSVQPGASAEVLDARQGVSIRWTVYAPAGVTVTARSAVRYAGRLYDVDGEPQRWTSPTGGLDHAVLYLVDREG